MTPSANLIIMAKAPRLGHGKSRLAQDFGAARALRINRTLHRQTLRCALRGPWRVTLAVAPRSALRMSLPGVWPPVRAVPRIDQGRGDLAARIARVSKSVRGPVCVIGTDAWGLTPKLLAQAFKVLAHAPAVIGPAADGGFWLVGTRRSKDLIASLPGVRWSTQFAGADIAARLPQPVLRLPKLIDVDDASSWRAVQRRSSGT